jgi:isochorismate synthase
VTAVAGPPKVGAAGERAAARARALAAVRAPRLVSVTVPAPDLDPVGLFAAARASGLDPALWMQPAGDLAIVGIGEAWATSPAGPGRFAEAAAAWAELAGAATVSDDSGPARGTGPLLLGGFAFDAEGGADAAWAGFGAGRLVLPLLSWARTPEGAWLTMNVVAPGPGSEARRRGDDGELPARRAGSPVRSDDPDALAGLWARTVAAVEAATGSRIGAPVAAGRSTLRVVGGAPSIDAWRATVDRYAGAVGRGRVDKVVLARRVDLVADGRVDVGAALRSLAASALGSTVFAVARGDAVFLGATPERLVRTEGRDARTVAIAGTAARGSDPAEDDALAADLLASEKEREEHEVVVRMLRDSLRPLCASLEIAPAPRIIRLGTVQHLCTDVSARTTDRNGILSLVGVLHPTPAVGGQPRDAALDLIRDQEPIDRGWYAGPLGWLDRDGDGEFVVALRSGVVRADRVSLFAGCGIVADSDPDREWEESRIKLRALGGALGSADL